MVVSKTRLLPALAQLKPVASWSTNIGLLAAGCSWLTFTTTDGVIRCRLRGKKALAELYKYLSQEAGQKGLNSLRNTIISDQSFQFVRSEQRLLLGGFPLGSFPLGTVATRDLTAWLSICHGGEQTRIQAADDEDRYEVDRHKDGVLITLVDRDHEQRVSASCSQSTCTWLTEKLLAMAADSQDCLPDASIVRGELILHSPSNNRRAILEIVLSGGASKFVELSKLELIILACEISIQRPTTS